MPITSLYIGENMLKELEAIATRDNVNISYLIREAIAEKHGIPNDEISTARGIKREGRKQKTAGSFSTNQKDYRGPDGLPLQSPAIGLVGAGESIWTSAGQPYP